MTTGILSIGGLVRERWTAPAASANCVESETPPKLITGQFSIHGRQI